MKGTWIRQAAAYGAVLALGSVAQAQLLITDFSYFSSGELYASWASENTIIDSGETSYTITATGYGSNYAYIGAVASGMTHVELEVTLSGPPEADGKLGPIINFVDDDGTFWKYAFYGQRLGTHILRAPLMLPTGIVNPGATPGLNLDALPHMHMELDPSTFTSAPYTVEWQNLQLIAASPGDFDGNGLVDGADALLWQRGRYPFNSSFFNLDDFKANFGAGGATAAIGVIPEPAAAVLIALGVFGIVSRRRSTH